LGWHGFVDQHEKDAEDDEEEAKADEQVVSFQLYEVENITCGAAGHESAEFYRATVYSALGDSRSPSATSITE
jgi:hypothetical protein